jgi:MFS transporter, DHA1 family, tetracycline resistance protein
LVQGGLVGRLAPRLGEPRLSMIGAVVMGVSLGLLPFAPRLAWMVIGMGALSVGNGLLLPTLAGLLSRESSADSQGGILGLGQALQAAARAVGPLGAGALYDWNIHAPYLLGAAILAGVAILAIRIRVVNDSSTSP